MTIETPAFRTVELDPPWLERGGGKIKRGADKHYDLLPTPKILDVVAECPLFYFEENAHMFMWVTDNFIKDGLWLMDNLGFDFKRTFQWVKVKGKPKRLDFDTGIAVQPDHEKGCGAFEAYEYIFDTKKHYGCTCGAAEKFDLELRYGIGQYARGAHEMMLFGVRGKGLDESVFSGARNIPSVFFAPNPKDDDGKRIHSRKPNASYELIEARSKGPYLEMFARRQYSEQWTCWGNEIPEAA